MMRSLWTAATGMKAMQFSVDTIANNLANVSTTAYKKEKPEFEDLLYVTMQQAYSDGENTRPVNLQVGHGVVARANVRDFTMGAIQQTGNKLDMAIEGDAFFLVRGPDGNPYYTRDGSFKVSMTDMGKMLATSKGYPVLDRDGLEIYLDTDLENIIIEPSGEILYRDPETGTSMSTGQFIGLFQFENVQGLEAVGGNMYRTTSASGEAIPDEETENPSTIRTGFLEASNVQVVEEMVKLITAQRAYELNSKAITTSDEMLQVANNLRR
ncbi:flagellar basal-body rod protein FlgG [Thermoclostridium caenicola]|uniref:Flagellar basal-body rod protein FlgG n=1 Tax=Thermoclostridium caenicola TaxID=659425 RepID=A0A1M6DRC0_9FIRM|nr:flagellar basal-body rod protein FlgG [Thermoclostridium caenicola]SHI75680.1 flagellar basal-body rod protein FlgG [Thermoclostridium caenicola]